ncbi:HAMP domain-containing sensor histidine kinase [Nannocystis sp. ILAH1]|uniref:sensor histidine kinase n=1 Tax=Nannocystis sp. ILAH1 TaxID=2996789 RepID=UPI002271E765|nr:HAMP domain-containing sensor histidine kinase [Nannocystis sp. ILAH1]MCY0991735.1 HAMP domain-containing sensor histidine kinase [Nannocystis sp. ILAH1]
MSSGSLRWRLVRRLVALQAALLAIFWLSLLGLSWLSGGPIMALESEDRVLDIVRESIARAPDGSIVLRSTPAFTALRADVPGLWFTVHDAQGHWLTEGDVPPEYARIGDALDSIGQARLGWNLGDPPRPTARVKRMDTAAGTVQIMTGPGGTVLADQLARLALLTLATVWLPGVLLMALATLVATPLVVRRTMRGLDRAAADAMRIDVEQRGVRLPVAHVPAEAAPLVDAVNAALCRLDEGYVRQQRFLLDAAHELRTPIAILQVRLEGLPDGAHRTQLLEDVARLANLAEQMLDAQRLRQKDIAFAPVDLAALARRVAADLAPLAIAAGYGLSLEDEGVDAMVVDGDHAALERALANLVQNAIQHGGRRGTITLRVLAPRTLEVADQGEGIPAEERERIFEPFHRLRAQTGGTGLGLHLAREIVQLHGARITVRDETGGGACFRIAFPPTAMTPHLPPHA